MRVIGCARGYGFPRRLRLILHRDFGRVFAQGVRRQEGPFVAICLPNDQGCPRLGLALRRKALPRAVDRNRIKRLTREVFRLNSPNIPPVDIVITAQGSSATQESHTLGNQLRRLLVGLASIQAVRSPLSS